MIEKVFREYSYNIRYVVSRDAPSVYQFSQVCVKAKIDNPAP